MASLTQLPIVVHDLEPAVSVVLKTVRWQGPGSLGKPQGPLQHFILLLNEDVKTAASIGPFPLLRQ